jgi:nitrogen-specific signal transduction histidine kinase
MKCQLANAVAGSRRAMDHNNYEGLALALFEETDDALILFDAKTQHILDANAAAQRLCGIGIRDLLDTPVSRWFRSNGVEGLTFVTFPERKVNLPFDRWKNQLRTFVGGSWLSVDLTVTRLAVKPRPLVLLMVRAVGPTTADDSINANIADRPTIQDCCDKSESDQENSNATRTVDGSYRDLSRRSAP